MRQGDPAVYMRQLWNKQVDRLALPQPARIVFDRPSRYGALREPHEANAPEVLARCLDA